MLFTKKAKESFVKFLEKEMGIVLEDIGFRIQKNADNIFDMAGELEAAENLIDEKLYGIEDDMEEVKDAVSEMEEKLEWYDLDNTQSLIENNNYEIECMGDKVDELEEQIEELEDTVNELKKMVKTLMDKVAEGN